MTPRIIEALLWLYLLDLALVLGAGVYEARIQVPTWFGPSAAGEPQWNRDAARRADVGLRFWVYVSTVPLTLLTLGSAIALWWTPEPIRLVWAGSVAVIVVERVATFGYFIPTMIRLTTGGADPQDTTEARRWVRRNHVRHGANVLAWGLALQSFGLWWRYGG